MHGRLGDFERATATVEASIEINPNYGPAWRQYGQWLLALDRADDAAEAFARSLEHQPKDVTAAIGLVKSRLEQRRPDDAIALIKSHELIGGINDAYAHQMLASALQQRGDHAAAASALRHAGPVAAVSVDPLLERLDAYRTGRDYLLRKAEALDMSGQHDAAVVIYEQLISAGVADADVYNMLALSYRLVGDIDNSVASHRAALQFDPDHGPSLFNLAWTRFYTGRGNPDQLTASLQLVNRAIDILPDTHDAYALQGTILEHLNRTDEAIDAYRAAYDAQPERAESLLRVGLIELERRNWAEAQSAFARLLADHPKQSDARIGLALAQMEQNLLHEAERTLADVDDDAVTLSRPAAVRARLAALQEKMIGPNASDH